MDSYKNGVAGEDGVGGREGERGGLARAGERAKKLVATC
jgi:hypothetical protein